MKTLDTIAGKLYTVTSPNGCTVTDETGLTLGTVDAGQQKTFVATGGKLQTDDDNARVTATFNRAALALGQSGGGRNIYEECSSWADVLAITPSLGVGSPAKLSLPALCVADANKIPSDAEIELTIPREYLLKSLLLAGCTAKKLTLHLPRCKNTQYILKHHVLKERGEVYAPEATNIDQLFRLDSIPQNMKEGISFYVYAPEATVVTGVFYTLAKMGFAELYAPKAKDISDLVAPYLYGAYAQKPRLKFTLGQVTKATNAFSYCKNVPDADFPTDWQHLKYGKNMFTFCELGKEVAINILNSLPSATEETGTDIWCITVGVHVDHQADEEVIAAITGAEEKGWTVTAQWNGTATADASVSTYGLRRRNPVYAKLGAPMEDGKQHLDWGHYVTDPSGYMEFASLEEAKEYFGVTE